jgi:hypothetical protein
MVIFSDLIRNIMEVFMDDFSVYGKSFEEWLEKFGQSSQEMPRNALSP